MNPRGLTGITCNFGSGVSAMSGFSLFTRYVLLIFSLVTEALTYMIISAKTKIHRVWKKGIMLRVCIYCESSGM